jgi:glycosyltransferase involved in cell wall biosynthesis
MKVLFASGNGYPPEFHGGVQSSTDHLVKQLRANGHDASVLAALFGSGMFGLKQRLKLKALGKGAVVDHLPGYPVARAWFPAEAMPFAVARFKPDVAVVQCQKSVPIAKAVERVGVPVVIYLRNVEFHELEGDLRELGSATYIANSTFTAKTYRERFGVEATVIPPSIDAEQYRTTSTREVVTFINPYSEKGFERAVQIAQACPDIPFLFVEGWLLDGNRRVEVESTLASLSNATFMPRTSDMRSVYGCTKILLAPSKWQEAWGRVASEAQCSGIPVVGSNRGGLPEAIGDGGVVLDYVAPLDDWVGVVRRLWTDEAAYSKVAHAALRHSQRPALQPVIQFADFLEVLGRAIAGSQVAVEV